MLTLEKSSLEVWRRELYSELSDYQTSLTNHREWIEDLTTSLSKDVAVRHVYNDSALDWHWSEVRRLEPLAEECRKKIRMVEGVIAIRKSGRFKSFIFSLLLRGAKTKLV